MIQKCNKNTTAKCNPNGNFITLDLSKAQKYFLELLLILWIGSKCLDYYLQTKQMQVKLKLFFCHWWMLEKFVHLKDKFVNYWQENEKTAECFKGCSKRRTIQVCINLLFPEGFVVRNNKQFFSNHPHNKSITMLPCLNNKIDK